MTARRQCQSVMGHCTRGMTSRSHQVPHLSESIYMWPCFAIPIYCRSTWECKSGGSESKFQTDCHLDFHKYFELYGLSIFPPTAPKNKNKKGADTNWMHLTKWRAWFESACNISSLLFFWSFSLHVKEKNISAIKIYVILYVRKHFTAPK